MLKLFRGRSLPFYMQLAAVPLLVIGAVFFGLSYTTGYNQIVYGEKNSIIITVFIVVIAVILAALLTLQMLEKFDRKEIYNIAMVVLAALFILCTLLLLVDRVDAIGNCIVAPWDAGHGGEDSCYLAFVAMGCWILALAGDIVGCFFGYAKQKDVK